MKIYKESYKFFKTNTVGVMINLGIFVEGIFTSNILLFYFLLI